MSTGGARSPGEQPLTTGAERAREALSGTRFADVRWVPTTGSTNSDAMALARDGAAEGVVVVADHQSAGRGRQARTWVAPPGGSLLVSVLLRPPARVAGAVTMAAAVAMAEAIEDVSGVVAGLKWPNDLVVATDDGDRKLAGILAEADWPAGSTISGGYRAPAPHDRTVVVVGIGLNVTWPRPGVEHADGALDEVTGIATALNWLAAPVDRADLLVAFLRRLDALYTALRADDADAVDGADGVDGSAGADGPRAEGRAGLLAEWRRRSATLGRRIRVDLGAEDVEGTAVDVTVDGHLVVETLEGVRRTLAVGDVVHLRPL